MATRFQKRIKILPGVKLNVSKSGLSASFGPKGAKYTVGHGKQRTTIGIPGTGLSTTKISNIGTPGRSDTPPTGWRSWSMGKLFLFGLGALFVAMIISGLFN